MEYSYLDSILEVREWFLYNQAGEKIIYMVGFFTLMALLVIFLTKRFRVPVVVGYVFLGILLSVDLIERMPFLTQEIKEWYAFTVESFGYISNLALGFIAFTIGSELSVRLLKKLGKNITYITFLQAFGAFFIVALGVLALGYPLYMSLLFGAIATATAPAATVMVLKEYQAEGMVTSMILAVVAIDDALALIIFSLVEPIALIQQSGQGSLHLQHILLLPAVEIIGSIVVGLLLGYISQKIVVNEDDKTKKVMTLIATIVGGSALSILFHLSPLITNMSVGFAYRNFSRKNPGIAEPMDTITIPLYAIFFILAGTEIMFDDIASLPFLILAGVYFLTRIVGKIGGSWLGALISKAPEKIRKYVGLGLLPQSGVAIALAYTVQQDFINAPEVGNLIFNILLLTAALTEVVGPLATKYAVTKAGESQVQKIKESA
ncbi:MAG: cation:proton antiporter [Halanaerobiaceae bacterium]